MASATKSELMGARLKARFSDWFSRLRDASEIRSLSAADLDSIAHDLRVWRTEFETLVVRRRQGAAELPKLLNTHGMEETIVARKEPGVLHDMTLLCALCVANRAAIMSWNRAPRCYTRAKIAPTPTQLKRWGASRSLIQSISFLGRAAAERARL